MKEIESVSIWSNGVSKSAKIFDIHANVVILNQQASFWYALYTDTMEQIVEGSLLMSGQDYQDWQDDSFAWDWAAKQLNLIIIADYVKPEPIVEEIPTEEEIPPTNTENV